MALSQHAPTGQKSHSFIVKVCRANTVRQFCIQAESSAVALSCVLLRQPEGVAFSIACHPLAGGVQ